MTFEVSTLGEAKCYLTEPRDHLFQVSNPDPHETHPAVLAIEAWNTWFLVGAWGQVDQVDSDFGVS